MHSKRFLSVISCTLWVALALGGAGAFAQTAADAGAETPQTDPLWIDVRNARMPREGLLVGGQPTPEQLAEAASAGYRTVINLRGPGELDEWDEAANAAELGLGYVALPIAGSQDLTVDNARKLREILSSEDALPAMVHCASGNRVGALFALAAFHLDGDDLETAMREGTEAGLTRLADTVRKLLEDAER